MQSNRLIARTVGILFIIGTVAGILSLVVRGSVLSGPNFLAEVSSNETRLIFASLLVLVMAFSLALIPVVLFPTFRKYNEIIALAAVVFRGVLEAVAYIAIALTWLLMIGVSRKYTGADSSESASFYSLGGFLQGAEHWSSAIVSIVFSLGALMIYWLFYQSKLIPRWLAVWGLVGAVLYLVTPLLSMFGVDQFGALMAPLAIQEMVLAIWLIVRGFSSPALVDNSEKAFGAV